MNNESIKEVEDFIQAYLTENDIMMKKLLGLSPDINLDDEENERLICDAIDNLVCGTEERREYFYRRIEEEMGRIARLSGLQLSDNSAVSRYPSATSRAIISVKPRENISTPMFECSPEDISGISSSTTT